jgi:ABC-2 type transport system ATP-binding protein
VDDLIARSYRRVRIEFAAPVDPLEFESLAGVNAFERDGNAVSFTISGDLDPIVKHAARHEVVDLEVTHPNLEEIFVAMYGQAAQ